VGTYPFSILQQLNRLVDGRLKYAPTPFRADHLEGKVNQKSSNPEGGLLRFKWGMQVGLCVRS
jgi:hypothetical protein